MNTEAFAGKSKAYVQARPSYPDAAIDYIRTLAPQDAIFADIGAGTGIFTELIAKYGNEIFAVEPNRDMRETLANALTIYPNVKVVNGSAECTTLPDNSTDVIVCAQALNWFNIRSFRAECRRIGKIGCIAIVIYNRVPGINKELRNKQSTDAFFSKPTVKEFANPIMYDSEKWLLYMSSHAGVPLPDEAGYSEYVAEVNALFERESVGGLLRLDVVTNVFSEAI